MLIVEDKLSENRSRIFINPPKRSSIVLHFFSVVFHQRRRLLEKPPARAFEQAIKNAVATILSIRITSGLCGSAACGFGYEDCRLRGIYWLVAVMPCLWREMLHNEIPERDART